MPDASPEREPRKRRLLRLMLLQIAILSIANGCTGGSGEAALAPPAPRHRYVEARFVPADLSESLDRMANRGTDPRKAIFPVGLMSRTPREHAAHPGRDGHALDPGETSVEHTATSRLDSGRLVIETTP